ncbi:MAG: hypothetical protein R3C61_14975 [Bacteroidia bacterium]
MAKKLFKNLKSLFIVEEEESISPPLTDLKKSLPKTQIKQPVPPVQRPNPIIKKETPAITPITPEEKPVAEKKIPDDDPRLKELLESAKPQPKPPAKKINQEYADALLKAMQQANLAGLDYLEFKESLEALSKITADEETRYKSAYAVVSAMGTNVYKLIETARHYIDVLNKAKEKFNQTVLKQMQDKLVNKKKEVESLEKSIQNKKAQIQKLNQEIDDTQRKMIVEMSNVEKFTETVALAELEFTNTFEMIRGKIDQDIKNMREYLTTKAVNPLEEGIHLDEDMES